MSQSQPTPANPLPELPAPTLADVAYGPHERNVLDFWQADTAAPAPTLMYIHGGGWLGAGKEHVRLQNGVQGLLDAGISVVSINYRYIPQIVIDDEAKRPAPPTAEFVAANEPPVTVPLYDAARALQFVRSKASEWNIDKARIAVSGGSAGACSSLWLAFTPDRADPRSSDPVARESTRPWCAAVCDAQTTLDPAQIREWMPNGQYGGHAFGFAWNTNMPLAEFADFLANRETILPWIERFSPFSLASAGAPPIYLYNSDDAPAFGQIKRDPTHSANYGALLMAKLRDVGVPCEHVYPGAPDIVHANVVEYLVDVLKA